MKNLVLAMFLSKDSSLAKVNEIPTGNANEMNCGIRQLVISLHWALDTPAAENLNGENQVNAT